MITKLKLKNFRGLNDHELSFKKSTVIVGRNNAGKSTIAEALRLVAIISNRYLSLQYREPPQWTDLPRAYIGVKPSLANLGINFQTLFYVYAPPPAIIECSFSNNTSITIYLKSESEIHAVIRNQKGEVVKSKHEAQKIKIPLVNIMPQIGPLRSEEKILDPDYVEKSMFSYLSSIQFRNQLNKYYVKYAAFQSIVTETWPDILIEELVGQGKMPTNELFLMVRNNNFVGEIATMGHGLQMWLQTLWFMIIAEGSGVIILDEPDVYMHADLQRKLVRLLRSRFDQVIITTHSVEIMSEVEPEEILIVDKYLPTSSFANSLPAVQSIIEGIGSIHNVSLARLWHGKRFLIVEGKDIRLLRHWHSCLFPNSMESIESIPNMEIGGWGGWNYAIGSSNLLHNAFGEPITIYCIFDSDYHTESEITSRYEEANRKCVELHVWERKEIENYLLIPEVIQRFFEKNWRTSIEIPSISDIREKMLDISNSMRNELFDAVATEHNSQNRRIGQSGANEAARTWISKRERETDGILKIISGKAMISKLSEWAQNNFKISLNANNLAKEMHRDEIQNEVVRIISAIENGIKFH